MADKKKDDEEKPLREEPIIERLVGGSRQVPTGLTRYIGLLGRSPKKGYWLLYLTLDMSLSVEIQEDDIVHSEQLPPDKSPFGSLGGTEVYVKKGAKVTTTRTLSRTHEGRAGEDEFDLDIRLGTGSPAQAICEGTKTTCEAGICQTKEWTCAQTCPTCQVTCLTCYTNCDQQTCGLVTCAACTLKPTCTCTCLPVNTCLVGQTCFTCNTCLTKCDQQTCALTCQTCETQCEKTCNTCYTKCGQNTCNREETCHTCKTDCNTCNTCQVCTHVTCYQTCDCP